MRFLQCDVDSNFSKRQISVARGRGHCVAQHLSIANTMHAAKHHISIVSNQNA